MPDLENEIDIRCNALSRSHSHTQDVPETNSVEVVLQGRKRGKPPVFRVRDRVVLRVRKLIFSLGVHFHIAYRNTMYLFTEKKRSSCPNLQPSSW